MSQLQSTACFAPAGRQASALHPPEPVLQVTGHFDDSRSQLSKPPTLVGVDAGRTSEPAPVHLAAMPHIGRRPTTQHTEAWWPRPCTGGQAPEQPQSAHKSACRRTLPCITGNPDSYAGGTMLRPTSQHGENKQARGLQSRPLTNYTAARCGTASSIRVSYVPLRTQCFRLRWGTPGTAPTEPRRPWCPR